MEAVKPKQTPAQRNARTAATAKKADAVLLYAQQHSSPGTAWEKTWEVDGSPCPECLAVDGETVDVGAAFSDGLMGPPRHPNCECDISLTSRNLGFAEQIARQLTG